jgi:hypothetical protein
MKLPMQVAPIQRNFGSARYAMSSGIKPSENLCSCKYSFPSCYVARNNCPSGYSPSCSAGIGACLCWCCENRAIGNGPCIGPYE